MRMYARVGLVALIGVSALMLADAAASPARVPASDRRAAIAEAEALIAGLTLPADATRVPREPAGDAHQLADAVIGAFFAAEVDRNAFWTTSASPAAVLASFRSHLPAGMKLVTSFWGGGSAGAAYALGTSRRFVVGPEQLMLRASTLNDGLTGVRADAQVRYLSPRPASERVPLSARLVQITKAKPGAKPLVSLTVTRRALVRRLGDLIDALPFAGNAPGAFACPDLGELTDTFIFRAGPSAPALARVSLSASTPTFPFPCAPTTLTIRGHPLSPLLNGGILLRRAGQLIGVRLTR